MVCAQVRQSYMRQFLKPQYSPVIVFYSTAVVEDLVQELDEHLPSVGCYLLISIVCIQFGQVLMSVTQNIAVSTFWRAVKYCAQRKLRLDHKFLSDLVSCPL